MMLDVQTLSGMGALGATTLKVVDDPRKCPSGSRSELIVGPIGGSSRWECVVGEGALCEWFGWGCVGVAAAPPAAPKTVPQLKTPGAWTPEQSAGESWEETQRRIAEHFANTSGVAIVPSAINQGVEGTLDVAKSLVNNQLLWLGVGAAGVILLLVTLRR